VVRSRIEAAGGDPSKIAVVAVTKGFEADAPMAALEAGIGDIGENYAGELLTKAAEVSLRQPAVAPRWHYLGAIQRNKVSRLAAVVSCWQSVARAEEAVAIAKHTIDAGRGAPDGPRTAEVFVEVDLSGQPGRGGCAPSEVAGVVDAARRAGCRVRGLMTVAPLAFAATPGPGGSDALGPTATEIAADAFGKVARLATSLGLGELSMGMSHDLEQAVAAGSTMVRIGTALFGERPSR